MSPLQLCHLYVLHGPPTLWNILEWWLLWYIRISPITSIHSSIRCCHINNTEIHTKSNPTTWLRLEEPSIEVDGSCLQSIQDPSASVSLLFLHRYRNCWICGTWHFKEEKFRAYFGNCVSIVFRFINKFHQCDRRETSAISASFSLLSYYHRFCTWIRNVCEKNKKVDEEDDPPPLVALGKRFAMDAI